MVPFPGFFEGVIGSNGGGESMLRAEFVYNASVSKFRFLKKRKFL